MNRFRTFVAVLLVLGAPLARAQAPAPGPSPGSATTTLDVHIEKIDIDKFPLIYSYLTVIDPEGRAINSFERRSFQLFEQGIRCRLENFKIDRTPLVVSLLMDCSGSMFPSMLDLKRAMAHFIRVLEPYDQALLMAFADIPRILVPLTYDQDRLVTALGPVDAYGPTALYDAIHKGVLELSAAPGRRVMVLMTDGQDQNAPGTALQSRHSLKEALELARRHKVVIYPVGLGRWINRGELKTIAEETKGEVYMTPSSRDLERIYMLISRNLKSRIEFTYKTPEPRVDGAWRTLEMKVSAQGGFGADQAIYRAPGRYVMELPGQGFDRLKVHELQQEPARVRLRDLNLKELLLGGKKEIGDWLDSYFKR